MLEFKELVNQKNEFDGNLKYGIKKLYELTNRDKHIQSRAAKNDRVEFIDAKTSIVRDECSKKRHCPVCDTDEYTYLFLKEGYEHVRCNSCRHIYVKRVLNKEAQKKLYSGEDSYQAVLTNPVQIELDVLKFKFLLSLVNAHISTKGKMLDVGCGPGIFLDVARDDGWDVCGVELNKDSIEKCKSKNIKVISKVFNGGLFDEGEFDFVSLWYILEHIDEVGDFLWDVHRVLRKDGILAVCVPNVDSLVTRMLREKAGTFGGLSHINFFNKETLEMLLKKAGYRVLFYDTFITEIGAIANYLNFDDPYNGDTVGNPVKAITPQFIYSNYLGHSLAMIAIKA